MKKILIPFAAIAILFSACKKNEKEMTKTELISAGKWLQVSSLEYTTANGVKGPDEHSFDDRSNCEKDDYSIFTKEFKVKSDEGLTKCNPADPQESVDGTWEFKNNETVLSIIYDFGNIDFDIEKLDKNTFTISFKSSETRDGINYIYYSQGTFTLVK